MGIWELVLVFVVVLLFFGATRLPALGEGLGKAIRNLRGAADPESKVEAPPRRKLPGDGGEGGQA